MKSSIKNIIIFLISIFLIFIIISSFFLKKKEGFSINSINNMFNDVKNITKVVGEVPEQINNIDKKLTQQVNNMGKEIEKNTINLLTNKLKSIFIQIGDIFNNGLINPMLALFNGIGNIFIQIFNIFV